MPTDLTYFFGNVSGNKEHFFTPKTTVTLTYWNEKECQTEGRIPMQMCLEINVYSIYKNKLWTVVYR